MLASPSAAIVEILDLRFFSNSSHSYLIRVDSFDVGKDPGWRPCVQSGLEGIERRLIVNSGVRSEKTKMRSLPAIANLSKARGIARNVGHAMQSQAIHLMGPPAFVFLDPSVFCTIDYRSITTAKIDFAPGSRLGCVGHA